MSAILVDTNIIYKQSLRHRLTERIAAGKLQVYVPTLVHAERIRQLADKKGEEYSVDVIRQAVDGSLFQLLPFDVSDAEAVADIWHDLKAQRLFDSAGEATDYWRENRMDLLLCAVARSRGYILITDDSGKHFELLTRRMNTAELEAWLSTIDTP